ASSGLHSNGYSLARKVLPVEQHGAAMLVPTRIYVRALKAAMQAGEVRGAAHITGGGLVENPPRVLADGLVMRLDEKRWPEPEIFQHIARAGVERQEMRRTFNCGLGLVIVVPPADAEKVRAACEA